MRYLMVVILMGMVVAATVLAGSVADARAGDQVELSRYQESLCINARKGQSAGRIVSLGDGAKSIIVRRNGRDADPDDNNFYVSDHWIAAFAWVGSDLYITATRRRASWRPFCVSVSWTHG